MKMTTQVAWVSRHPITDIQIADLKKRFGIGSVQVHVHDLNITWVATGDPAADELRNRAEWEVLYNLVKRGGIIAGVFPPVALEARRRGKRKGIRVVSPVSRQAPEDRVGDGPIPFKHVRWAVIP